MYLKYKNITLICQCRYFSCAPNKPIPVISCIKLQQKNHDQHWLCGAYCNVANIIAKKKSTNVTSFTRPWDTSCNRIWDSWEEHGKSWVIQDLPPEHDDEALRMFLEQFCPYEVLCAHNNLVNDSESMRSLSDVWRKYLAKRMSLACYVEENGKRKLAAVNICMAMYQGEDPDDKIYGDAWKNVYDVLAYIETKADKFQHLEINQVLYALGIVVAKEFRGSRLGVRVLMAREPLSLSCAIRGTAAIFTGPASQKIAKHAGFRTIATVNMKELAEAGLKYPKEETKVLKLMIKKY